MRKPLHRDAIALMITLLFIMLITISIGIGLKQLNEMSKSVKSERFLLQTSMVLDDVMRLLKTSKELEAIKTGDDFAVFLAEASFIPFESSGVKVIIELKSARSKFAPNTLVKSRVIDLPRVEALKNYFNNYMVNIAFVDILLDTIGGIKEDMSYNSDIFNTKPNLFRDYIASSSHFEEIKDFYTNSFYDDSLKHIDFEELFYYGDNNSSYSIDLNYATVETLELILGVDKARASQLNTGAGAYTELSDLDLQDDEKLALVRFKTSFYEPYIDVLVEVMDDDNNSAEIKFEYSLIKREGSNFVYEI